ncbi:Ribosomal large subunit pseudouridine synthase D [Coccomyxa sp. Obi]|nr:Ribosomal large subunit pseudouridine synthase D [Coccomyxa sp. Obi]
MGKKRKLDAVKQQDGFFCPACNQMALKWPVFSRHLQRCCPDLLSGKDQLCDEGLEQAQIAAEDIREALKQAVAEEEVLRRQCIQLTFTGVDDEGERIRRDVAAVADLMHLPEARIKLMLHRALRAIPLVADAEPITVIYEDDDLLAVSKPPFLVTAPKHRWQGGSLVNRVLNYLGKPPHPLHRLDMNTSGVVLFAKTPDIVAAMHEQFREQQAQKQYLAIGLGIPNEATFSADGPIGQHPTLKVARMVCGDGLPSRTDFWVLGKSEVDFTSDVAPSELVPDISSLETRKASLLCCAPRTGRTHQIRVHLAHSGHPIAGDEIYGLKVTWTPRQLLHAVRLRVTHPRTNEPLDLQAPLPEDFERALARLGIDMPQQLPDLTP